MATSIECASGVVTQSEVKELRQVFEMVANLWDDLRVRMDDVEKRKAMGCRVERGPETLDVIWLRATAIAEDVLRRKNTTPPFRKAG